MLYFCHIEPKNATFYAFLEESSLNIKHLFVHRVRSLK